MSDGPGAAEIREVLHAQPKETLQPAPNPWVALYDNDQPSPEDLRRQEERAKGVLTRQEREAKREAITEAKFAVRLDKVRLAGAEPLIKRDRKSFFTDDNTIQKASDDELRACLDRMSRLPERLEFQPGITLIVGENGGGKSTLGKALHMMVSFDQSAEALGSDAAREVTFKPGYSLEVIERKQYERDYRPNTSDVEFYQSGLAPQIAEAMEIDVIQNGLDPTLTHYYDATTIMGQRRDRNYIRTDGDYRSHRQTVDEDIWGYLIREKERAVKRDNARPGIYFIDEPETGMSPRRHHGIQQEILDSTIDGSIVICPTNSIVLFDSDLPRIDLDFPERGVHRPSQYKTETVVNAKG